jgi:hypothetical protein
LGRLRRRGRAVARPLAHQRDAMAGHLG